ncbi:restriction endonuclease subunit S [Brevibacillus sp. SYSU BS000544]|uniref:restriction endonuclease subunit S n=1 Tax=Brevibacillus sp. SYSU BS000544 TaxID=3416443 RepID=UPI003CE456DA
MSRKMKVSGIEWIGVIPDHWRIVKIKNICSMKSGLNLISEQIDEKGNYPVYGGNGLRGYYHDYNQDGEFVLVGRQGALCGNVNLVSGKFWATEHAVVTTCNLNSNVNYCYRLLYAMNLNQYSISTAQPGLAVNMILNLYTCLPPMTEQIAIAQYLDQKCNEIDSIIQNTKSSIEEYKAYKQSVITEAVTKGLNTSVSMKESDVEWIGEMPEHWSLTKVKYLLDESIEKSIEGKEEPLSMSQQFGIVKSTELYIPHATSSYIGGKLVYKNYLVFNKLKAHLGVFAVSPYNGVVSPDYAVYVGKQGTFVKFLEYLFKTKKCIQQFKRYIRGVGAGLSRLYTSDLFNIQIALPSYEEQIAITEYIEKKCVGIDRLIAEKQKLISELENYKKSLIYECVTGKKEV